MTIWKEKRGVEGEPGSLQLHPRGVLPQALHWRHNDTVKPKAGAGNSSSASLLIIGWICHCSLPSSMAKSAEVKLAIFGRAGVGKSGMFVVWFFLMLVIRWLFAPCVQTNSLYKGTALILFLSGKSGSGQEFSLPCFPRYFLQNKVLLSL